MEQAEKDALAEFVAELEKATLSGDMVWDVELLGDMRAGPRRYMAGVVLSNGAVGCIVLQHQGLMFLNSHEYAEPELQMRRLWALVCEPNANVVKLATDGLRERMNDMPTSAVDLNEMGQE